MDGRMDACMHHTYTYICIQIYTSEGGTMNPHPCPTGWYWPAGITGTSLPPPSPPLPGGASLLCFVCMSRMGIGRVGLSLDEFGLSSRRTLTIYTSAHASSQPLTNNPPTDPLPPSGPPSDMAGCYWSACIGVCQSRVCTCVRHGSSHAINAFGGKEGRGQSVRC